MIRLVFFTLLFALPVISIAQEAQSDTLWKTKGILSFNIQQAGFSNWANGGESSTSWGTGLSYNANFADERQSWKNSFEAAFGFIKNESTSSRKNADLLIINSEYGRNLSEKVLISAALDIRSQFADGFVFSEDPNTGAEIKTLVSSFFAPGYIQPSLGLSYKEGDTFSALFSPLSNKLTIVADDQLSAAGAYGVTPGDKFRSQLGATFNFSYQNEVMENVNIKTNLILFGDYQTLSFWDVNYDLFIDFKVNKFITTKFLLQAIYDHDIKGNSDDSNITGPALQIRNVLNLGVSIDF